MFGGLASGLRLRSLLLHHLGGTLRRRGSVDGGLLRVRSRRSLVLGSLARRSLRCSLDLGIRVLFLLGLELLLDGLALCLLTRGILLGIVYRLVTFFDDFVGLVFRCLVCIPLVLELALAFLGGLLSAACSLLKSSHLFFESLYLVDPLQSFQGLGKVLFRVRKLLFEVFDLALGGLLGILSCCCCLLGTVALRARQLGLFLGSRLGSHRRLGLGLCLLGLTLFIK